MKKTILLMMFLSAVIMTGNVSGQSTDYQFQDSEKPLEVTYGGDELSFTVEKNSPEYDGSLSARVCGEVADIADTSGAMSPGGASIVDYPATFSFNVPEDAACGQGSNNLEIIAGSLDGTNEETAIETELIVYSKGDMDPHVAENIMVNYDPEEDQMHAFQLTDNTWDDIGVSHGTGVYTTTGNVMIQEYSDGGLLGFGGGERYIYNADVGQKTSPDTGRITDFEGFCGFGGTCPNLNAPYDSNDGNVDMAYWSSLDTISPIHDDTSYNPDGEIVHGYYPLYYNEDGNTGKHVGFDEDTDTKTVSPQFFICREGATMSNGFGEEVEQVVDVNPSLSDETLWRCDTDQGEWEENIYECQDGLDNDGDKGIDYSNTIPGVENDDDCSSDLSSEDPTDNCDPRIGMNKSTKYAYYDSGQGGLNPNGNNCNYEGEPAGDGLATGNPVTGTCNTDGTTEDTTDKTLETFCKELDGSSSAFHGGSSSAKAVKYYVPAEAIPTTKQNSDVASEFVKNTDDTQLPAANRRKCIRTGKGGFVNTRCETLHMAETGYSGTSPPHAESTWQDRNMTNLNGYTNDNPDNYENAWITGNASISTNKISGQAGSSSDISSPEVFDGGFAGKCPTGKYWGYTEDENRWQCSGALAWNFDYFVPDLDAQGGTVTTGIFLNSSIFYDGSIGSAPDNSLKLNWYDQYSETASIDKVHYVCYPGDPYLDQATTSGLSMKTANIPSSISSDAVFLPYDLSITTAAEYGCDFEFEISTPTGNQNLSSSTGASEIESAEKAANQFGIDNYLDLSTSYKVLANQTQAKNNLPPSFP